MSLTTFIDFVSATGTTRLTRVRRAKEQYADAWDPAKDFYKQLRDRISSCAKEGWSSELLGSLLNDVTDARRQTNYEVCRKGIVKWASRGEKTLRPYPNAGRVIWKSGELEIRVNPELLLREGDTRTIVKLYFKGDPLSQQKAQLALHLLRETLGSGADVAILDVRRAKLFRPTPAPAGLNALLAAEAAAFAALWNAI